MGRAIRSLLSNWKVDAARFLDGSLWLAYPAKRFGPGKTHGWTLDGKKRMVFRALTSRRGI
jgi:hypothetical protein